MRVSESGEAIGAGVAAPSGRGGSRCIASVRVSARCRRRRSGPASTLSKGFRSLGVKPGVSALATFWEMTFWRCVQIAHLPLELRQQRNVVECRHGAPLGLGSPIGRIADTVVNESFTDTGRS